MDCWEQKQFRRIVREELRAIVDDAVQPLMVGLLAEWLAAQKNTNTRDTHGACGTARKAPTVAESTATTHVSDSAPLHGGAVSTGSPTPLPRRKRAPQSAPDSGTDRADGLGKDDAATGDRRQTGGAAAVDAGRYPASIVTAHPVLVAIARATEPKSLIAERKRPVAPVAIPIADSREGCARCGTRGDIGCEHQRPFGTV